MNTVYAYDMSQYDGKGPTLSRIITRVDWDKTSVTYSESLYSCEPEPFAIRT